MASWLASVQRDDRVVTCSIARGEIVFGLGRLPQGQRRSALEVKAHRVLGALPCEPITLAAGDQYADVKLAQRRMGLSLDENDLWIAASALATGATLVSTDTDFQRVETLPVATPLSDAEKDFSGS